MTATLTRKPRTKRADPWAQANGLRLLIEAAPTDGAELAVVAIFQASTLTPTEKCDAFWLLDSKPGLFSGYGSRDTGWHSRLRRTRNHPIHGRQMFATFKD